MNNQRTILSTACLILATILCVLSFADNESGTNIEAEQHLEKANELRLASDYEAAITEFEAVISLSPNSIIAQNAKYWIGQLYFEERLFDTALKTFQELINEYPDSSLVSKTKTMIERIQQAEKTHSFFEAIEKGDIEQVKLLISEGANVNDRDQDGQSALNLAIAGKNKDLVELIIDKGADINGKGVDDVTPLHEAAWRGHKEIAELLIDKGADVNIPTKDQWTPLHSACNNNYPDMVKLLVANGADVNAEDKWGATPLYYAKGSTEAVKLLLEAGADVNAKGYSGTTALVPASQGAKAEVVKLLLEAGIDVNAQNDNGRTALMAAATTGSAEVIKLLLEAGADVNAKYSDGHTALQTAARVGALTGSMEAFKLLLKAGADINAKDNNGQTALHIAVQNGDSNDIELLLTNGADINAKDNDGHTPLYFAVNNDFKVAELLINKGADSTIKTESGQTLLQLAQERKQLESTVPDMIFVGEPNSYFGHNIVCGDIDGDGYDDILIREGKYDNKRGRVYLFYGGPQVDTKADLIFEGQNEGDLFGSGIVCGDIDNDGYNDIIIGASSYSEQRGRAYLYWGSDRNSMDTNPDKIFNGEQEKGSRFGSGYPTIYDIDNDGYDDIILSAYEYPSNGTGRAYLYYGNKKELLDTSVDLIFNGEKPGDRFSYNIKCGDFDNNGYGDIVIGTYLKQGRAYLYYGNSKSNMDAKVDLIFEVKSKGNNQFGESIVCFDQNRDGYDDIVIGARGYNSGQGRAYLFHGNSKSSIDVNPDMIFDGEVEQSNFGVQEIYGDIDGDNIYDLAIGTSSSGQWIDRVYVYWGEDLSSTDPKPGRILIGEMPNDLFGYSLACGDVNNDGYDDLVIGAHNTYKKAGVEQGRVYLYYGGPK